MYIWYIIGILYFAINISFLVHLHHNDKNSKWKNLPFTYKLFLLCGGTIPSYITYRFLTK